MRKHFGWIAFAVAMVMIAITPSFASSSSQTIQGGDTLHLTCNGSLLKDAKIDALHRDLTCVASAPTTSTTTTSTTRPTTTSTTLATTTSTTLPTTTVPTTTLAGGVTVGVNGGSTVGTSSMQLSTQLVWNGVLEGTPGGQSRLNALADPLIRIHAGTDAVWAGHGPELPEGLTQGSWSFAELNSMVNNVYTAGSTPLLNIRYAPNWMWTCSTPFTGQSGYLRDPSFVTFGDYLARLVSYYNTGSMTTENGTVITNPLGSTHRISTWELWNEPDLNNETPCAPTTGVGLTAAQYAQMWNVVTPKMRAVDPTIQLVGPTIANPPQPFYDPATDYIGVLESQSTIKPNALSFHLYGYWDNTVADKVLFDGDQTGPGACCGGIAELVWGLNEVRGRFPNVPIYVTEGNVNADWGTDPTGRPSGPFGVAWGASEFRALVLGGASLDNQYQFVESPQFGLIDDTTGTPYLSYWRDLVLGQSFPAGSTILSSTTTNAQIETLAVRKPDGKISVMVINRRLNSNTTVGGAGVATTVNVSLTGVTPTAVTLRQIDTNTTRAGGPATQTLTPSSTLSVTLPGYGMAVLQIAT